VINVFACQKPAQNAVPDESLCVFLGFGARRGLVVFVSSMLQNNLVNMSDERDPIACVRIP
jgi:hypothetical protein